ncbi:trypsin-7-like [Photinus pyralis]|uniref:trypsin-7-like n=1 Tax=Photinus pyralis TaxID=7054 RepID=UPI001267688F|nr:trypsin-7-like [Photinus pyralis]
MSLVNWTEVNGNLLILLLSAAPPKIVNGTDAKEGEIPYIVSVRYIRLHTCGGSIINENNILTAAHCMDSGKYTVQYGLLEISSDYTNSIDIEKVFTHEEYNPSKNHINDVAVLRLASAIRLDNANLKPVTLPSQGEAAPDGEWAVLAGWGSSKTGGGVMKHLQRVNILVYSPDDCKAAHGNNVDERHHICAGVPEGWKGQCSGDSGGPFVANGKQVGIVSWSVKPCAVVGYPGVLARVASYHDWISAKVNS